jgi:SpoVK/Ycf46/Vps4 family AAA+-type ATPase
VTTNAGDRIDAAFERRMDVAIEFHPPQAAERWEIWQTQLPSPNAVDGDFLGEVATRCTLSGGQIRNAVLHACLLAVDAGGIVTTALLDVAVRREYRKAGAVCPLRGAVPAVAV